MIARILKSIRGFRSDQDGNATIEFVLFFPALIGLFLMGFESGYYMMRSVMLDRAVDISVRDVRLSNNKLPDFDDFKKNICRNARIIPNCVEAIQVEMMPVATDPGEVAKLSKATLCRDVTSTDDPADFATYDIGQENEMMLVRVCALSKPLFPTSRLGAGLIVDSAGNLAIVSTAAFVSEPGARAVKVPPTTGTGTGAGE